MRGEVHSGRSSLFAVLLGAVVALTALGASGSNAAAADSLPVLLPSFAPLIARVAPAVVDVVAMQTPRMHTPRLARHGDDFSGPSFRGSVAELLRHFFDNGAGGEHVVALGSGFIIDPQGYIVTSDELATSGDKLNVTLPDHTSYPARIIGRDAVTDLALIKIETHRRLPYLSWGDSASAAVGDWVIAIGNPFGLGGTVTAGIISAVGRSLGDGSYDDLMQIDAPINRGDSGGPTIDLSGRIIGVNTALYAPAGGSVGIGFAVPADIARKVVAQLRAHGHASWGWLGVSLETPTPSRVRRPGFASDRPQGALVAAVAPNGPAAKAGLKPGDVIVAANGRPIRGVHDLPQLVERASVGSTFMLTVRRHGRDRMIAAKSAAMPHAGGHHASLSSNDLPRDEMPRGRAGDGAGL
jgi:serine protease Do